MPILKPKSKIKTAIRKIRKRTGEVVAFNRKKIEDAIFRAAQSIGGRDRKEAERVTERAIELLVRDFGKRKNAKNPIPSVEDVQDHVESALMDTGHFSTANAYSIYRKRKNIERKEKGNLGVKDDLKLSLNAIEVLEKRYLLHNGEGKIAETPAQLFHRVARHIASAEKLPGNKASAKAAKQYEREFYKMMESLEFLPNSPTLMNAGTKIGQLAACFILPVPDDMRGIFNSIRDSAIIHQSGGGTGFCFSYLRPKGDMVKSTSGIASGPVSFMAAFDKATEVVKQGGKRRGANMGVLHVWHPDIEEFIIAKQTPGVLENFNVSVAASDLFMRAVKKNKSFALINPRTGKKTGSINARNLFLLICKSAWLSAEPGMLFMDMMNRSNPTPKYKINATNPCAEVDMPDYESCTLGSINLAKFVELNWRGKWKKKIQWGRLRKTVRLAVRFLDNVVELNNYPLPKIREMSLKHRRIGLGIMGFAKMLCRIGIRYDSSAGYEIGSEIMRFITKEARKTSIELGKERGSFPGFNESTWHGKYKSMRNATVTSIAPTGTISMIADTSSGIEPLFALSYLKKVAAGEFYYTEDTFEAVLKERRIHSLGLMRKVCASGSVQGIPEVPSDICRVFEVSHDIPAMAHVKMQATFQKHVDLGVSKTINLPKSATVYDVERAYLLAWKLGCKGISIYRDTSRREQVLYAGKKQ